MIILTIIKINGIYDILCSMSILKILPNSSLTNIHKNIFKYDKQENIEDCYKLFERILAFLYYYMVSYVYLEINYLYL